MTKQDFELIAKVISHISDRRSRAQAGWAFVSELSKLNNKFDPTLFLKACNLKMEDKSNDTS